MPYLQKATANYFGFMPADARDGAMAQTNSYLVSATETALAAGDVLMMSTIGTVKAIPAGFTQTSSAAIVGVCAQSFAAGAGSTAATLSGLSSALCLVYDDPTQVYVVNDTTSGVIGSAAQTAMFKNYAILATGVVGSTGVNTNLGRSVMALSGVTATAAGAFHVIGMHPVEGGIWSTATAFTATSVTADTRKYLGRFTLTVHTQTTQLGAVVNTTS